MRKNEPITAIMTADPIHVEEGEKPSRIRQLLSEHGIHHVPVTREGKLVGIVSSTDMMRVSMDAYGSDPRAFDAMLDHQFTITALMQSDPVAVLASETVRDAALKLSDGRFHSLPVVNDAGMLAGIVTSTDLIGYLLDQY